MNSQCAQPLSAPPQNKHSAKSRIETPKPPRPPNTGAVTTKITVAATNNAGSISRWRLPRKITV